MLYDDDDMVGVFTPSVNSLLLILADPSQLFTQHSDHARLHFSLLHDKVDYYMRTRSREL